MAAVQPAGPLPRMMTFECFGECLEEEGWAFICFAAHAGLAMSYGYGARPGQAALKAKPVHKVMSSRSDALFCRPKPDSRNIIAGRPGPRYDARTQKQDHVWTPASWTPLTCASWPS